MADDFAVSVPPALAKIQPVDVALILGSGLSSLADLVENPVAVPYGDIEEFPMRRRLESLRYSRASDRLEFANEFVDRLVRIRSVLADAGD